MKEKKVYFFGDSIAFGQGVSICDTWVVKTAQFLKTLDNGIIVNNLSINGNTTRMALERMAYDIQGKDIYMLIIEFGMNDCNYWVTDCGVPRVSEISFKSNLIEIIERAFIFNPNKLVLLTNHVSGREDILCNSKITYQENNKHYNEIIREVVEESVSENVFLIDIEKYFIDYSNIEKNPQLRKQKRDNLLLEDGIHLSRLGHDKYYEFFVDKLKEII